MKKRCYETDVQIPHQAPALIYLGYKCRPEPAESYSNSTFIFFKEQWDYFHSIAPFKISTGKTRVLRFAHTCAKGSYIILPLGTERSSTLFLPAGLSPQITNQSSGIGTKIKPNQFALK